MDAEAALVATVLAERRPARALADRMRLLVDDPVRAAALFDSVFYRLPPYAEGDLPAAAAEVMRRVGRSDAALLLDGLAAQMQAPRPLPDDADAVCRDIVAAREQDDRLHDALVNLARRSQWAESAALFERVWPCLEPVGYFWVHFRMSAVYAALGRHDAARLMAALAVQIEPAGRGAREPYARLLDGFRALGRLRDAVELAERQIALSPAEPVIGPADLAALRQAAGPLAVPPPTPPGRTHVIAAREMRPAQVWRKLGRGEPIAFRDLNHPILREAVVISELRDAEVLADRHTVAVLAEGAVQAQLSVGGVPGLLGHRFAAAVRAGTPPPSVDLDTAVLVSDEFPHPNLCHFLLDHAPRLLSYRRAGVDLARADVIGPPIDQPYQRETLARIGVGDWHVTDAMRRFRVRRLFVSSTCHANQHPAHLGASWAIGSMRALFDLAPRDRRRRLLISRADATARRLVNEAEIATLLASFGFETIVPGRMTFAAQIAAFREATHVIGPHGAGLANILFCAPGTRVLEVMHPHYATYAYAVIAPSLGLDYTSLVAWDGGSDAAEFNALPWTDVQRNMHMNRDIRIDPEDVRHWLDQAGTA
jgi:capsular polysaccharide biosynthesis protein/tetratricopeptide (TPR) repeat protein